MQIHPYAWLITGPLTIALVQLAMQPSDNPIKQSWGLLCEMEAETWFRLGRGYQAPTISRAFKLGYAMTTAAFGLLSVASLCAWLGIAPTSIAW